MKKLIILAILAAFGWQTYTKYQSKQPALAATATENHAIESNSTRYFPNEPAPSTSFKCDGRIYCSQMTSCEEATFFLRNCPSVKMDGNNDGIPCEKQWCK